jgi:hypothetical protein
MLVEPAQVLDAGHAAREGWGTSPAPQHEDTNTMDPAAIGTTLIGLDTIRDEEDRYRRGIPPPHRARPRTRGTRRHLADVLRRVATRIEPRPAPAR